mmetsp:Transcript_80363/g.215460  ORF Transcript_80363/g.215460 Transcript_80363/m.215460 type:complete len:201 (+) Transcript_80363:4601-5203(+)
MAPNTFMNCAASMSWYTDAPAALAPAEATDQPTDPATAPATEPVTLAATTPATMAVVAIACALRPGDSTGAQPTSSEETCQSAVPLLGTTALSAPCSDGCELARRYSLTFCVTLPVSAAPHCSSSMPMSTTTTRNPPDSSSVIRTRRSSTPRVEEIASTTAASGASISAVSLAGMEIRMRIEDLVSTTAAEQTGPPHRTS